MESGVGIGTENGTATGVNVDMILDRLVVLDAVGVPVPELVRLVLLSFPFSPPIVRVIRRTPDGAVDCCCCCDELLAPGALPVVLARALAAADGGRRILIEGYPVAGGVAFWAG